MSKKPNLMILGSGRHGKDFAAEFLSQKLGYTFISSSEFVGRKAVYPATQRPENRGRIRSYASFEECFEDRHTGDNRAFWYDTIQLYNAADPARLARELYREYNIYVGLRSAREFNAARQESLFDLAIWVDAFDRMLPEASTSLTITRDMADIVIDNSGTKEQFVDRLQRLVNILSPAIRAQDDK